jgi:hypothetical protein
MTKVTEYTPNFKSVKEDGIYPIRSSMVLIKNQGNCTVLIDYVCELPPNGAIVYNMESINSVCVWNMHVGFKTDNTAMYEGDNNIRKNLIIGQSHVVGHNYSNYQQHGS